MAIENRFASEEYVLNQIEDNNNNIVLDWSENDSNSNNYIKNRTHYPIETVTLTWDGDESNYEIYEDKYDDSNYIKFIKISDTVNDSIKEIISNSVCKYTTKDITYDSSNRKTTTLDNQFLYRIYYNLVDLATIPQNKEYTAEFIAISFLEGESKGYSSSFSLRDARVIFVLQEGFVGAYTGSATVTLPVGIYLTKVCQYGQVYITKEYSYTKTKKLNESYLTDQGLAWYSKDDGNNLILQSYSTAEGYNNVIQKHVNAPSLLLSLDLSGNNIEYEQLATHVEGRDNSIFGPYNHGEGQENKLFSTASHIEGYSNIGGLSSFSASPNFSGIISGKGNHIEGYNNLCGDYDGVHVEGYYTEVQANYGHSEGTHTKVTGQAGHAQNSNTQATGKSSTASGSASIASGQSSDAGNVGTEAKHEGSFTRGFQTTSGTQYQAIVGQYNEIFTDSFFDVGNGSSSEDRKTAFSVKKDGSARLQLQGTTNDSIARKDYVDGKIEEVNENIISTKEETIKEILNMTNAIDSWESVQKIVRAGYAPLIFKIGDQLVCNHTEFGELTWDIIGFDHDTPVNNDQYPHSMTLQLHNVLDTTTRDFDSREALFCAMEEIGPGKYYLDYNNKIDNTGSNTYLYFTVPENVTIPANGLIANINVTGNTYSILADCFSADHPLGSFPVSVTTTMPTDAIYLGKSNYFCAWPIIGGSNNYLKSNIRFYLNGDTNPMIWEPQDECDMPPTYINNAGFMFGLDQEFKNVLGKVVKSSYNQLSYEIENFEDFIFLPSQTEMYAGQSTDYFGNAIIDGTPYEYYINNSNYSSPTTSSDSNRIKYDSQTNTAYPYYLRSPLLTSSAVANGGNILNQTGAVSNLGAIQRSPVSHNPSNSSSARYLAPCCCIV